MNLFIETISSYEFLVVAFGTMILAAASAMVGTISVLKEQSLIGDAISHSAFPGIVIAFILFNAKDPLILTMGAMVSGGLAFFIIQALHHGSKVGLDTLMAVVLSSMFGLGMALKTFIDSGAYTSSSQAGLNDYIFGQAAYTMKRDVYTIIIVAVISILILLLFYKEIKAFVFDPVYASTIGISSKFVYTLILIMTMALIGVGIKIVGAILISSMLIAPAVTGLMWSNRFSRVIIIAAITGIVSAFFGTYFSTTIRGFSTGPTIIVIMSAICLISILVSPKGLISTVIKRNENRRVLQGKGGNK